MWPWGGRLPAMRIRPHDRVTLFNASSTGEAGSKQCASARHVDGEKRRAFDRVPPFAPRQATWDKREEQPSSRRTKDRASGTLRGT